MNSNNYHNNYRDEPRKMYKIICADCGKEAEVPFKPDGVRPVYCQECYKKHRQEKRRGRFHNNRY